MRLPLFHRLAAGAALLAGAASSPAQVIVEIHPADTVGGEPRVERVVVEDDGARIEELHVRGEVRSIKVRPKGSGPKAEYEIVPTRPARLPSLDISAQRGLDGQRVWKVLNF